MTDTSQMIAFTEGFAPTTEDAWRALAEAALKGGTFEKRLVSTTLDGRQLQPVYPRAEGARAVTRGAPGTPWSLGQRVDHPQAEAACTQALVDLEGGADMLTLVAPDSSSARGYGMPFSSVDDLDASLKGVALDIISLRLDPAPSGRINAALIAALAERRGHDPATLSIDFGMDPIGNLMTSGAMVAAWPEVGRRLADATATLRARGFAGPFITCDVRPVHEAGGTETEELAAALAMGVAYLRALTEAGMAADEAERSLSFTVAVDADQFASIAKLRALRTLWARVQEASGLAPHPITLHAETAWRMMTRHDPAVNMLRTTLATFSAGVGGADSITVLPYTAAHGLPDAFARRVARNTQTILLEESNLWRVADPAAGSGAYEAFTDDICAAAWSAFQDIERGGGIIAWLEGGRLQQVCGERRADRIAALSTGRAALTGTSAYPTLDEAPVRVLDVARPAPRSASAGWGGSADASLAEWIAALSAGTAGDRDAPTSPGAADTNTATVSVEPLPSLRLAEPFEALRLAAQRATEATGKRPTIFIANIGPMADNTARTTWITNLLATAGIDAHKARDGFTASGDVGSAFAQSGLAVACICGSDDTYAELAEATVHALKSAGATHVRLAGRPGDNDDALTAAGLDGYLHAGQDSLATLGALHGTLGIAPGA